MSRTWRCAVVGVGTVGEWHVRTLPQIPGAQLVALCDLQPEKCTAALDKNKLPHVPVYADQFEMLKNEQIDVIHVCTPSGNHMDPVLMALEAGKNVICEKPMEIHLDRIDQLIAAARRNKVRLAGIFQNRWNPANRALKDAAVQGRFGRIGWAGCFTPWYRDDRYYEEGGWRGTWKLDGGGAIMNQSVHAVDLLQWIVGPVRQVSAYGASRIHGKIEVEDTLSCALQFANGAFGTIMGSTAMYPGGHVRVEVGGENGTACTEGGLKTYKFRDEHAQDKALLEELSGGQKTTGGGSSATEVALDLHGENSQHLLDAWAEGKDADTAASEARKAVAIILAMYESVRNNGAPVQLG